MSHVGSPLLSPTGGAQRPMDATLQSWTKALNAQHLRLLIKLIPSIKNAVQFDTWIRRAPVLTAWSEFKTALPGPQPDPDFGVILRKVFEALNSKTLPHARICLMHPDKRDWSAEDHHARFVVAVVKDSLLEEIWTDDEWNNARENIIQGIFEVLIYLKATSGS